MFIPTEPGEDDVRVVVSSCGLSHVQQCTCPIRMKCSEVDKPV